MFASHKSQSEAMSSSPALLCFLWEIIRLDIYCALYCHSKFIEFPSRNILGRGGTTRVNDSGSLWRRRAQFVRSGEEWRGEWGKGRMGTMGAGICSNRGRNGVQMVGHTPSPPLPVRNTIKSMLGEPLKWHVSEYWVVFVLKRLCDINKIC